MIECSFPLKRSNIYISPQNIHQISDHFWRRCQRLHQVAQEQVDVSKKEELSTWLSACPFSWSWDTWKSKFIAGSQRLPTGSWLKLVLFRVFNNTLRRRRWRRDWMFSALVYLKLIPGIFIRPTPTKGLIRSTMLSKFVGVCHLYRHSQSIHFNKSCLQFRSGSDESASRQVTPQQHPEPTRVNGGSPLM